MSGLRPPVGIRLLFLAAVVLFAVACFAAQAFAGEKLLLAHTHDAAAHGQYRTTVIAVGGAEDAFINLTDVVLPAKLAIPAGEAVIAENAGEAASVDFALIGVPDGLDIFSSVSFLDSVTGDDASFSVPPFGAFSGDAPTTIGPIVSTDTVWTWLTMFARAATPVRVTVLDGAKQPIATEYLDAAAGLTHYRLTTKVPIGYVTIVVDGPAPWHCFPRDCKAFAPVFGFGLTSRPNNGNARAFPFGTPQ